GGTIDAAGIDALIARFEAEHERVYGVRDEEGSAVEIRALRLAVIGAPRESDEWRVEAAPRDASAPRQRSADFGEAHGTIKTPVVSRAEIPAGGLAGPLLVDEYDTTIVVPPGWTVARDRRGILTLTGDPADDRKQDTEHAD